MVNHNLCPGDLPLDGLDANIDANSLRIGIEEEHQLIFDAQRRFAIHDQGGPTNLAERKQWRDGDVALAKLMRSFTAIIKDLSKSITPTAMITRDDLIQKANEELIKIIKRFDLSKPFRLVTYAHLRLRYCMIDMLKPEKRQRSAVDACTSISQVATELNMNPLEAPDFLIDALNTLEDWKREIIFLKVDGYSFTEIAAMVGKRSVNGCRGVMDRFCAKMRAELEKSLPIQIPLVLRPANFISRLGVFEQLWSFIPRLPASESTSSPLSPRHVIESLQGLISKTFGGDRAKRKSEPITVVSPQLLKANNYVSFKDFFDKTTQRTQARFKSVLETVSVSVFDRDDAGVLPRPPCGRASPMCGFPVWT